MKISKKIAYSAFWLSLAISHTGYAVERNICVFDPVGKNGPIFSEMRDYQAAALGWGVTLKLKPYTDERVAAEDFKSGMCDGVSLTGVRARQFNSFTGTLDSIGSLPTYEHLKTTLQTLSSPKAAKYMIDGPYQVAGIIPAGAAYLLVRDRSVDTVGEMSGKRIAVMENDDAQKVLVMSVGASPVASSITNMYSKFNNGAVDICAASAPLYEAMELEKGLKNNGGVIRFALAQVTFQLLIHNDKFPADFGQQSREYYFAQIDRAIDTIRAQETKIAAKLWIDLPDADKTGYMETFRQARLSLREKGIYNGKMLTLLRKIRCKITPTNGECTATDKE